MSPTSAGDVRVSALAAPVPLVLFIPLPLPLDDLTVLPSPPPQSTWVPISCLLGCSAWQVCRNL